MPGTQVIALQIPQEIPVPTPVSVGLFLLSAVGLPMLAIIFLSAIEAAFTKLGIWDVLSKAGLDICRISLGIVGALFLDIQIRVSAAGTVAAAVLFLDLILAAFATIVSNRALDLGIQQQSSKAYSILAFGIVSIVIPAVLIVLYGGHNGH
jgi:hypothetical protein